MHSTKQLSDEHQGILQMIDILENVSQRISSGENVSQDDLAAILDFLKTFADRCHHVKEG